MDIDWSKHGGRSDSDVNDSELLVEDNFLELLVRVLRTRLSDKSFWDKLHPFGFVWESLFLLLQEQL